jgi:hypothetical protein
MRYRINRLLAVYRPATSTAATGITGIGFVDDPDTLTPEGTPQTLVSLEELRCSHTDSVYRDIEVEWFPIDKTAWYFCAPSSTGSLTGADIRMETPVAFASAVAFATPSMFLTLGVTYLYYDITFVGAVDPSPTVV